MAVSVDWPSKVISVPRADMLLIQTNPTEIRELDIDAFRLELRALEYTADGMPFIETHTHNKPVTVGGVTLARVVEIINGYTVTFEDGQYAVNLVGANSNIADVTNVNQVSVRSANSAGLTYSKEIENQSFQDARIFIDTVNGSAGTQFPRGSQTDPVSNFPDAEQINTARNLSGRYLLHGSVTFSSDDLTRTNWLGTASVFDSITLGSSTTTGAVFTRLTVDGTLNGAAHFDSCEFHSVMDFQGTADHCQFEGTTTIKSTNTAIVTIEDSTSHVAGGTRPILDINGANCDLSVRRYTGGLTIKNFNQGANASFDILAGTLELDSTCTSGTIVVRGMGNLIDNSGVGCTVISTNLLQIDGDITQQFVESGVTIEGVLQALLAGIAGEASGAQTAQMQFFAPDGTTPRITADHDGLGNRTAVALNTS